MDEDYNLRTHDIAVANNFVFENIFVIKVKWYTLIIKCSLVRCRANRKYIMQIHLFGIGCVMGPVARPRAEWEGSPLNPILFLITVQF